MRTPSRDDQDLYDQCVALQATIDERDIRVRELEDHMSQFGEQRREHEAGLQAVIVKLERTVEAKRQTIEHALMIDEKQQNKIAEQKATIDEQSADIVILTNNNEALERDDKVIRTHVESLEATNEGLKERNGELRELQDEKELDIIARNIYAEELQATIEELEAENEALREILEQCGVDADELIALKERDHENA